MYTTVTFLVSWKGNRDEELQIVGITEKLCAGLTDNVFSRVGLSDQWFLKMKIYKESTIEYKYQVLKDGSTIYQSQERSVYVDEFEVFIDDGELSPSGLSLHLVDTHQLWLSFGQNSIEERASFIQMDQNSPCDSIDKVIVYQQKNSSDQLHREILSYPLKEPLVELVFTLHDIKEANIVFEYIGASEMIIGKSFVSYGSFEDSGRFIVPIISTQEFNVIGQIAISYLLVAPFTHPMLESIEFADEGRIFRKDKEQLYIGHRGSGANSAASAQGTFPPLLENTLLSFRNAATLGYDYIEFDINLSGDGVPVIFHDFSIPLLVQPNIMGKQVKIPITSLLLEEFKLVSTANQLSHHSKGIEHDSYPTLCELFDSFPTGVGFDIEVKYPGYEESIYCNPKFTRNEMVDRILKVVFDALEQYDRPIFFSSFDPECCVLLSKKQPKYPVFFLTEAGEMEYPSDPRKNSLEQAIRFCKRCHLFGIVCPSNIVLSCSANEQISLLKYEQIVVFTWGNANNSPENVYRQQNQGVDGIISDHISNSCVFP